MPKVKPNFRTSLVWLMILLAVITVLSPAALRADACLRAFGSCLTDVAALALNPLHWMVCINGLVFCYAYLPT